MNHEYYPLLYGIGIGVLATMLVVVFHEAIMLRFHRKRFERVLDKLDRLEERVHKEEVRHVE